MTARERREREVQRLQDSIMPLGPWPDKIAAFILRRDRRLLRAAVKRAQNALDSPEIQNETDRALAQSIVQRAILGEPKP